MRSKIEQRHEGLCRGLLHLYSLEKEVQAQLAKIQGDIKDNIVAIAEMELLLSPDEQPETVEE